MERRWHSGSGSAPVPSRDGVAVYLTVGWGRDAKNLAGRVNEAAYRHVVHRSYTRGVRETDMSAPDPIETDAATPSGAREQEFRSLVRTWRRHTAALSRIDRRVSHPAYLRIIGMGPPVLPLIFEELDRRPDFWFTALQAITGENPAAESRDFEESRQLWLAWWQQRGRGTREFRGT